MTVSYAIPLLVLLGMLAWLVDLLELPFDQPTFSYAPFLGFFEFNFYSWLTILDSPDSVNGLPLKVPDLIQARSRLVYFLATSWISLIFIMLMAWRLDEWASFHEHHRHVCQFGLHRCPDRLFDGPATQQSHL